MIRKRSLVCTLPNTNDSAIFVTDKSDQTSMYDRCSQHTHFQMASSSDVEMPFRHDAMLVHLYSNQLVYMRVCEYHLCFYYRFKHECTRSYRVAIVSMLMTDMIDASIDIDMFVDNKGSCRLGSNGYKCRSIGIYAGIFYIQIGLSNPSFLLPFYSQHGIIPSMLYPNMVCLELVVHNNFMIHMQPK
jgi:hypothetical protein